MPCVEVVLQAHSVILMRYIFKVVLVAPAPVSFVLNGSMIGTV